MILVESARSRRPHLRFNILLGAIAVMFAAFITLLLSLLIVGWWAWTPWISLVTIGLAQGVICTLTDEPEEADETE